jgi:hypothetical protein
MLAEVHLLTFGGGCGGIFGGVDGLCAEEHDAEALAACTHRRAFLFSWRAQLHLYLQRLEINNKLTAHNSYTIRSNYVDVSRILLQAYLHTRSSTSSPFPVNPNIIRCTH